MDWADDIAYSVHDLEDFYRAGLLPLDRVLSNHRERDALIESPHIRWTARNKFPDLKDEEKARDRAKEALDGLREYAHEDLYQPYRATTRQRGALRWWTSFLVGRYVRAISLREPEPDKPAIALRPETQDEIVVLKAMMEHYVFNNPALAGQQHGQRRLIRELFQIFVAALDDDAAAVPELVPMIDRERYTEELGDCTGDSSKLICRARNAADAVASLTERQVVSLHRRLTGVDPGSIWNLIVR